VALSVQREDPCLTAYAAQGGSCRPFTDFMFVTVLDRDGNELLNIEQADPRFDDFHGYFAPIVWRNDGEGFMVHGYTGSEAPGGNATILLDGVVVVSSFRIYGIYVAPNGRYLFADDWVGCNLSLNTERHALRIVDALSEDVIAEVHEPSRNIAPLEWSPDGEELLYRTADVVPGDDGCPAEDMETATWHILRASGGDPAEIPGVMDARRAWYGERLIEFECLGQPTEYSGCVVGGAYGEIQVSNRGRAITSAIEYQTIGYLPATRAE
jgi:hypothetical protein